jgi:hypothetical protein
MFLVTLSAVDRSGTIRLEWNLGFYSTVRTCYIVHLSWTTIITSFSSIIIHIIFPYILLPFLQGNDIQQQKSSI